MTKLIPVIRFTKELGPRIKIRGRLIKETPKSFTFLVCLNRCEKCPQEHFYTIFKGRYWVDSVSLEVGKMYEVTLGINRCYLNPIKIRESIAKSFRGVAYVRGAIVSSEVAGNGTGTIYTLSNGVEIFNPGDMYDLNDILKEKDEELLIAVQLGKILNNRNYISNGVEYEGYNTCLTFYSVGLQNTEETEEGNG